MQCAQYVRQHRIIMIPTVEQAVEQFRTGRFINEPRGLVRDAMLGEFN